MAMTSIIGLSGYAGAGKNAAADFLALDGYRSIAFADELRRLAAMCDPIIGWDNGPVSYKGAVGTVGYDTAKRAYPEMRTFLQKLGDGSRQVHGDDVWVNALFHNYPGDQVVITDVRYRNEAEAIRARGGVLLRIERPGVEAVNDHISEHDLDGFAVDGVVVNDTGLTELAYRVRRAAGIL